MSFFLIIIDKVSQIILAVKAVIVEAPSSSDKPLEKEISKSFVSNETLFLFFLFA